MTKLQTRLYKQANQKRREQLLTIYHGVKPSTKGWLILNDIGQSGKYSSLQLPYLSGNRIGQLHNA